MKLVLSVLFSLVCVTGFCQSDFSGQVENLCKSSSEKGLDNPVIFIGSSSIRMWKTLEQDFPGFSVLNHGFGGSEYSDLLKYQAQLIEDFEPSMIVVYAGDNDIANAEEPSAIAEEAETFVDGLRRIANGSPVLILSVKPSITRWELKDKYIELNGRLKAVAASFDHAVFVDVWSPMLKRNKEVNPKLFVEDGLHMNEKGYEIWRNALLPFLSK